MAMIGENIAKIKERISEACRSINRDPKEITIIAASKGRDVREIKEVIEAGIIDIGENRIQEALLKYNHLSPIRWHFIGHLQTNKVKDAVRIFNLIQSVDSIHLAGEINKQAVKINKIQDVLIEVKTSPETTKFGLEPNDVVKAIREMTKFKNISIKGLMTIAPIVGNSQGCRPYFRTLREIRDEINAAAGSLFGLQYLSMGMTDDFEVAIEEGANIVRIGRAIFNT